MMVIANQLQVTLYIVQHSALFIRLQPDDGLLEAETCSWLAVVIIRYIYI